MLRHEEKYAGIDRGLPGERTVLDSDFAGRCGAGAEGVFEDV